MLDFPAIKRGAAVLKYTPTTDEELSAKARLKPAELNMPEMTALEKYLTELGLRASELDTHKLAILATARDLEPLIKYLKIPMATVVRQDNKKILVEKEKDEIRLKTRYKEGHTPAEIPDNSLDVVPILSAAELPHLRPTEWMVEELNEDYFLKRLSQNSLLRNQWMKTDKVPERGFESVKVKYFVEETAPPEVLRQHAAVVLDRSGSMDSGLKAPLAKAMAIAFLKHGYENEAMLNIRTFAGSPDSARIGKTQRDLTQFVKEILEQNMSGGGTNIQAALSTTANEINTDETTKRADILLLTDGLSALYDNPLGNIRLHTFQIGLPDGVPDYEKVHLDTLKSWSTTYKVLNDRDFTESLLKGPNCMPELAEASDALLQLIEETEHKGQLKILYKRLEDLIKLMEFSRSDTNTFEPPRNPSVLEQKMRDQLDKYKEEERKRRVREMIEAKQKAAQRNKEAAQTGLANKSRKIKPGGVHEPSMENIAEREARRKAQEEALRKLPSTVNNNVRREIEQRSHEKSAQRLEQLFSENEHHQESFWKWCVRKVKEWWKKKPEPELS